MQGRHTKLHPQKPQWKAEQKLVPWHMPVSSALRMLRQNDQEFKPGLQRETLSKTEREENEANK